MASNIFFQIFNTWTPSYSRLLNIKNSVLLKDPKLDGNLSVTEVALMVSDMDSAVVDGHAEDDDVLLDYFSK